jgi:DNA-binding SARP family transcriptional activator/predicted ATPase/Tfp pilus assembly protein PilF
MESAIHNETRPRLLNIMLSLTLFGPVAITRDGKPIDRFHSRTEIALLVYLAHTRQAQNRETLADLLWEASSTAQSLSNLRTALSRLRRIVGDELVITRQSVALQPEYLQQVDSVDLQTMVNTVGAPQSGDKAARLKAALDLYRADFLAGFYLPDAPRFNEWAVIEQENMRRHVFIGLQRLITFALERDDVSLGIEAAQKWVAIDRLHEPAHAQLMRFLALGGLPDAALEHFERLSAFLDEEMGVPPGVDTVALADRIRQGEFVRAAPKPAPLPHNLPRELTPFIGRETELTALVERLLDPAYPLVTLVGEGGIGKTRLALAAARWLVAPGNQEATRVGFPDGAWFVPLAALDGQSATADILAATVGAALDLAFHGERPPAEQLLGLLRPKSCLIVLDNFEHLLESDAPNLVIDLLRIAQGVHLLVTSRAPLNLSSEFVTRLGGLDYPTGKGEDPDGYDSTRLFAERAARTGVVLSPEDAGAVAAICRYLAGTPLAIELAAAWSGQMPPAAIAGALADNLDFLASEQRDLPERRRSMRAVFEYSWSLLGLPARRALAGASIFRGDFSRVAAEAVIGADAIELDRLVDHSLLALDDGRYSLHDLLCEFAAEKSTGEGAGAVAGPGEKARGRDAHGAYYLALVEGVRVSGAEADTSVAAVSADLDNVRRAWRWAVSKPDGRPHPAALAAARQGLWTFYARRSLFQEGEDAFAAAIDGLSPLPKEAHLSALLRLGRGSFLNLLNRYGEAMTEARAALAFAAGRSDAEITTHARLIWGTALYRQGHFADALTHLEQGLAVAEDAGLDQTAADLHWRAGSVCLEMGDTVRARAELKAALAIYRHLEIRPGEGEVLVALGWLDQREMHLTSAGERLTTALAIHRALDNRHGACMALINLAAVHESQRDFSAAYAYRLEALEILETLDDRYQRSLVTSGLGVLLSRMGDYETARAYYEQTLAIDQDVGDEAGMAWTLNNLGLLYNHLGEFGQALPLHEKALRMAQALGARTVEGLALSRIGQDLHGLGRLDEAARSLMAAAAIQGELRQPVWAVETNATLAVVLLDAGKTEQALATIEPLLPGLTSSALQGAREPFRARWNCYRVLAAAGDARAAGLLADTAADLREEAQRIYNDALCRSFLERIPVHAAILSVPAR